MRKRGGGGAEGAARDVIRRTQRRLTVQYSALLLLFLVLFAAAAYSLIRESVRSEQSNKLEALLSDELRFLQEQNGDTGGKRFSEEKNQHFSVGADQAFYYWVDTRGNLIMGDESPSGLRSQALSEFGAWASRGGKPHVVELRTESRAHGDRREDEASPFLVAGRKLTLAGRESGTLYVGIDIASTEKMLHLALLVLGGLTLLFAVACVFLSRFMSRRAMVPISLSLTRQREFVADASHELRTPLSVLLASIEAMELRRSAAASEDPFELRTLSYMKEEVKGMTRLAGDLLDLARNDSGNMRLQPAWFDLAASAERTLRGMRPLFEAKRIPLDFRAPERMPVFGDEQRLLQLLVILTDNAVKYSPEGAPVRVALAEERQRQQPVLAMTVADQGVGISLKEQQRIFERFYREDKSRSREVGGHGLGLAIAKQIVEACGGRMQLASEPGRGSTFKVLLPLRNTDKCETESMAYAADDENSTAF